MKLSDGIRLEQGLDRLCLDWVGAVDVLKEKRSSWEVRVGSCYAIELYTSTHRQEVGSIQYCDSFIVRCLMVTQIYHMKPGTEHWWQFGCIGFGGGTGDKQGSDKGFVQYLW